MVRTTPSSVDIVGVGFHANQLRFYAHEKLDGTEDFPEHVAHNGEGHVVEQLVACAYNTGLQRFEVQVKWRVLDEAESSWSQQLSFMRIYTLY
ncbi:hypothetical protein PsorP6_007151 [Peronosclerospora sorghi]|uniref:Uncharacterized protein n=1 Tax=Peronosclerospora sorghi TaxID=230839 RepID=A0ACC0W7K0_9STRA|nr:hypothetical protein PsorP6_007151 [Peronosclerospora sorghi]